MLNPIECYQTVKDLYAEVLQSQIPNLLLLPIYVCIKQRQTPRRHIFSGYSSIGRIKLYRRYLLQDKVFDIKDNNFS